MASSTLCASPLSAIEQARLLGLLDALTGYLGAPGDWGYGTRLGRFTVEVLDLRHQVAAAPLEHALDEDQPAAREYVLTGDGDIRPLDATAEG